MAVRKYGRPRIMLRMILIGMGYGRPAGISDGYNITGWEIYIWLGNMML